MPSSTIFRLVFQLYNKVISEHYVYQNRDMLIYSTLEDTSDLPYGNPVKRFIAEFSNKLDVGVLYVTRVINSWFVTYMKRKGDDVAAEVSAIGKFVSVYQEEVETWRKILEIGDIFKNDYSFIGVMMTNCVLRGYLLNVLHVIQ